MVDWETVREIALALPEVEEDTSGRTVFRVRGKPFAWMARERGGGGLGVRVDRDEKQLILEANPDVYFSSSHYDGWPGVQIRLELIEPRRAPRASRGRLADPGTEAPRRGVLGANPS